MREVENHFLTPLESERIPFGLLVGHDIDNIVSLVKDPNVDDTEKQKLINGELIPNLMNGRNNVLLRNELLRYIEDKDLIRREVAFIGLEAINKADLEKRESTSLKSKRVLEKLESVIGIIIRGRS